MLLTFHKIVFSSHILTDIKIITDVVDLQFPCIEILAWNICIFGSLFVEGDFSLIHPFCDNVPYRKIISLGKGLSEKYASGDEKYIFLFIFQSFQVYHYTANP